MASALYPKRGAGPEQQKKKKATSEEIASILDCYVTRWQRWAAAGLKGITVTMLGPEFVAVVNNLLKETSRKVSEVIALNFRDPTYGATNGGLLPVECQVPGKIGIALFQPKKSVW
ncbi:MAG: hypothetical protein ACI8XW_001810 [Gammaproteobacteria bacterium]